MNKFQIFWLNFSWDTSKMRYFSNKIFKNSPSASLPFDIVDVKLTDYGEIKLLNISVTSSLLRHWKTSPKFSILALPNQNFWLLQWIKVIIIVISYFQSKVIVIIIEQKICNWSNSGNNTTICISYKILIQRWKSGWAMWAKFKFQVEFGPKMRSLQINPIYFQSPST